MADTIKAQFLQYNGTDDDVIHFETEVAQVDGLTDALSAKRDKLTSGTNIKTINNNSILGSGNVALTYSDVGADQSGAASSAVSTHNSNSSAHSSLFGNCLKNNENGTLTGNSSDTPLYLKSQSESTFLGFKNSSGTTLGYFGVDSSNKPVYYVSSNKQIALVEDVTTMLNRTTAVNAADTNYTSYMARGEALNSSDTTPTANGAISWTYE